MNTLSYTIMSNSKSISLRIPDELLAKIDAKAEQEYTSIKGTPNRSLVILRILEQYFNNTLSYTEDELIQDGSDTVPDSVIKYVDNKVNSLSNKFDLMLDRIDEIREHLNNHVDETKLAINTLSDTVNSVSDSFEYCRNELDVLKTTLSDNIILDVKQETTQDSIEQEIVDEAIKVDDSITVHGSVRQKESQNTLSDTLRIETVPLSGIMLSSKRFGLSKQSVGNYKSSHSSEKFTQWSATKDPDGIAWIINPNGSGFIPDPATSSELLSKLATWIEENIPKK